jgi:hypothetical protein
MVGDVRRLDGQWRAMSGAPVRRIGATWHCPLATDVTGEFTPAQRPAVTPTPRCARPTWVRRVWRCADMAARDVAAERAPAFRGANSIC